ncbi:UNVERIFIED_CONTAM: cystathionine beta-lyase family protein involved in aluminum resistance [Acetivibrio alkalicellulosi]
MISDYKKYIKEEFLIESKVLEMAVLAEKNAAYEFDKISQIKEYNQFKVIRAMQNNNLNDTHFHGTTGYGYDDKGRDGLESIYKDVFKAEDALVRHQIMSGTHALALCLYGNLRPGEELLSVAGKPYDTLEEVIGIRGEGGGSLREFGISYKQVELLEGGRPDFEAIEKAICKKTKMILIQRSKGYEWRPSLSIDEIEKIIKHIKSINSDIVVLVDNCYGEFVEDREPVEVGADLIAGSLIKNPGGGLALTGGYVVGKKECVAKTAYRMTAPGLGKKIGASLGNTRLMIQGLFMAPHVVAESLKGAIFCASLMSLLGFETSPGVNEKRGDIIQAVKFKNADSLIAFCQGIQKGSPVDSFVLPEPWEMPGYDSPVIMAAGAFVQGSSIELSADGPIKPPFVAYMQGGLVYEHIKLGVMIAVQKMMEKGLV